MGSGGDSAPDADVSDAPKLRGPRKRWADKSTGLHSPGSIDIASSCGEAAPEQMAGEGAVKFRKSTTAASSCNIVDDSLDDMQV